MLLRGIAWLSASSIGGFSLAVYRPPSLSAYGLGVADEMLPWIVVAIAGIAVVVARLLVLLDRPPAAAVGCGIAPGWKHQRNSEYHRAERSDAVLRLGASAARARPAGLGRRDAGIVRRNSMRRHLCRGYCR